MKRFFLSLVLLLAACGGPIGPVPQEIVEEPVEVPQIVEMVPVPIATPAPTPPPPPPPPLAPAGTWYLLDRMSVMTDQGVQAYPAGTVVTEVAPGLYDIKGELQEIESDKLTNNLEIISNLLAKKRAREWAVYQARLRAAQPASTAAAVEVEEKIVEKELPEHWIPKEALKQEAEAIARLQPVEETLVDEVVEIPAFPDPEVQAPAPEATPEEQVATRSYETDSGVRYQIRVRGASVSD